MRRLLLASLLTTAIVSSANADFTGKDASLATITFKNASGACTSVVCVPQAAITDSTGSSVVAVTTTAADAQSNIANGLLTYSRNVVFNGTTWDRWTGAVTNAGTFAVQLSGATNNINNISGTVSLPTGAATSALQTTANTTLSTIATNTAAAIPAGSNNIGNVGLTGPYPVGAVPITASATGTTAATTATLTGAVGKTTYICGYSIRANATAAATVTNTITGVITATLSSVMWVAPLASGLGVDEQVFIPCIPASATNTAIAVVSGAPGAGGAVSCRGWGYQL